MLGKVKSFTEFVLNIFERFDRIYAHAYDALTNVIDMATKNLSDDYDDIAVYLN